MIIPPPRANSPMKGCVSHGNRDGQEVTKWIHKLGVMQLCKSQQSTNYRQRDAAQLSVKPSYKETKLLIALAGLKN